MFFRNLRLYRLTKSLGLTAAQLDEKLQQQAFTPASSIEMLRVGWISPRGNDQLVHSVNGQMLIVLCEEKKLLPQSVIIQVTKARAEELEEKQSFKPGRKQMKELKEQVTDELLPRAFSIRRTTAVWIDPVHYWIGIDTTSQTKANDVFRLLLRSIPDLGIEPLNVANSSVHAMTNWLSVDEAPENFTIDQETELRAAGEGRATVKYVRHTLDSKEVAQHIAGGKQCIRLAMTWNSRVSFILNDGLVLKRIEPLDVLKGNGEEPGTEDEMFDSNFMLMTGEMHKLLSDLALSLGGIRSAEAPMVS